MTIIQSQIDTKTATFRENRKAMLDRLAVVRDLEGRVAALSNSKKELFRKRGKLLPRERLELLLDRGAPFLALSPLAGYKTFDDDGDKNVMGGCLITGIGYVSGVRGVVYITDSAIKGGTSTPMGSQKLLRAQEISLQQKLPFFSLIESGGGNLLQAHLGFGRGGLRFANQARQSAAGLPQVTVVHGNATAGGAYVPGLSDYVVMVRGQAKVFLAGPPLLKAATGEIATDEDLGGAEMHATIAGTADYMAADDADGIAIAREIVAKLNWNPMTRPIPSGPPPRYDPEELCGLMPLDYRKPYDVREVIARIVDESRFLEFKPLYDSYTVCGHADIEGMSCGLIGNNGPITPEGAVKATQFMQLCGQSGTPLIFLQNTTGFIVGTQPERGGIIKHGSKMIQAVTNVPVPRIAMMIGASYGAGNFAMCGRGMAPDFIFGWPNNTIAIMGGEQAAGVMDMVREATLKRQGKTFDPEARAAQHKEITDHYEDTSSALYATSQLWDDGIIDPRDSRRVLAQLLDICAEAQAREVQPNTYGIARM